MKGAPVQITAATAAETEVASIRDFSIILFH